MVASIENIDPNGRYTPGQTCRMLGISKTSLYTYDKNGQIEHELLPHNGRRVYRGKNILAFHEGRVSN